MRLRHLVVLVLCLGLLVPTCARALEVVVNGQALPADPPPLMRNDRVLLPMRVVFEALGAEVTWELDTQTAIGTWGDTTVRMQINNPLAYINDWVVTLDVPAQLINNRTYIPVRFPAEVFGAEVRWEEVTQTVFITLSETPPPIPPPPPPSPVP